MVPAVCDHQAHPCWPNASFRLFYHASAVLMSLPMDFAPKLCHNCWWLLREIRLPSLLSCLRRPVAEFAEVARAVLGDLVAAEAALNITPPNSSPPSPVRPLITATSTFVTHSCVPPASSPSSPSTCPSSSPSSFPSSSTPADPASHLCLHHVFLFVTHFRSVLIVIHFGSFAAPPLSGTPASPRRILACLFSHPPAPNIPTPPPSPMPSAASCEPSRSLSCRIPSATSKRRL
jgi:hypothetical protein